MGKKHGPNKLQLVEREQVLLLNKEVQRAMNAKPNQVTQANNPQKGDMRPSNRASQKPVKPLPRPTSAVGSKSKGQRDANAHMRQKADMHRGQVSEAKLGRENDIRRKKLEAVIAKNSERVKQLEYRLERKRMGINDKDKHTVNAQAPPALSVTQALNAIGVDSREQRITKTSETLGMSSAMEAIGACAERPQEQRGKRIEQNSEFSADTAARQPHEAVTKMPECNKLEEAGAWRKSGAARTQWDKQTRPIDLSQLTLEQTGSIMEATQVGVDLVTVNTAMSEDTFHVSKENVSSRRQWAAEPSSTLLSALSNFSLANGTMTTLPSNETPKSKKSSLTSQIFEDETPGSTQGGAKMGITIVIHKHRHNTLPSESEQ